MMLTVSPHRGSLILASLLMMISVCTNASAEEAQKRERIAVMVFSHQADEHLRAAVESDLRNMVVSAESEGKFNGRLYPIEVFFDGLNNATKLEKSQRHFNEAQRAFEKGDYDEAMGQLKRARRFYERAMPFMYQGNEELLQSIYYLQFLTHKALKRNRQARDTYCIYVSLSRSITGSSGEIDQYDVLSDMCGESPISGSAELVIKSQIDGAHVFVDNIPVGIVSADTSYSNPFIASGVHLVEVRKIGYRRWGKLVTIKNGKRKALTARLKRSQYYNSDFVPIADLKVRGADAFSDVYLSEFFYGKTERFKVNTIIAVYLNGKPDSDEVSITLIAFRDEVIGSKVEATFNMQEINSYYPILRRYWKSVFGFDQEPSEMRAIQNRWMPTLFKVE